MATANEVEAYLAALPEEQRATLETVRATIQATAPDATETISYQIPTFRWGGRGLVAYAAFKEHYSLFPMSKAVVEAQGEDLAQFRAGKGTLRFTADQPMPAELVQRIVQARMKEIEAVTRTAQSS
ncbi:MAG: DUF1801 domain-containing protein [Candidatus Dormibacteraeota bacterium]|uniref:DUF1801 domain-containing protein n=1 Tax=Candidatus Amunia macphersoniae TaxID=3127014 RepID=A0A934NFI6_9BACT|nr:DUF1801 domain-containing protein [Candidatus Dormibacteraeota bacterium]